MPALSQTARRGLLFAYGNIFARAEGNDWQRFHSWKACTLGNSHSVDAVGTIITERLLHRSVRGYVQTRLPASKSVRRAIARSGSGRSRNRGCAGGRSFTISNWMRCVRCGSRCGGSYSRRARNTRPGNGSARFLRPIRAAVLLGILQTPHRFRTKRQLWTCSGLGIETESSADHRRVNGPLARSKKHAAIRGLNRNCNHDLKNVFKGAAIVAASKPGPFQEFYTALLTKGIRPEMARLTLARKIATIVLIVWKRGACFDAQHLKPQTV
jgi:hypothetical protein